MGIAADLTQYLLTSVSAIISFKSVVFPVPGGPSTQKSVSNQFIYDNILNIKGKDILDKLFGTNLALFDVRGTKAPQHYNQIEIDACKKIVNLLVKTYGDDVRREIGIITPFKQQALKLSEEIPGVEIGTVHVFQGKEKKYILFSSVIDGMPDSKGLSRFIGGKGNLLNVAFSRAKEQFIYVGNLQAAKEARNYLTYAVTVIKQKGKIFSLFDVDAKEIDTSQDIIAVLSGRQQDGLADEIGVYLRETIPHNIIDLPRLHNEILNNLLRMATRSISIISPWIGGNVVTNDMLELIGEKLQNGVLVYITFGYRAKNCSLTDIDKLVKADVPWGKEGAAVAIRALKNLLGEQLKYEPPSHVKLLLVDDRYLFIGSLNWLYNSGKTDQKEISCLITDPDMIHYVKEKYLK